MYPFSGAGEEREERVYFLEKFLLKSERGRREKFKVEFNKYISCLPIFYP